MMTFFFFFGRLFGTLPVGDLPTVLFLFLVGGVRTFSFDVDLMGVIPTKSLPGLLSMMSA